MWTTDYFREVLGLSENAVHVAFGVVGITGPIIGAGLSGVIVTKLGGYGDKRVMPVVILSAVLAVSVSLPITYFDNVAIVGCLLWALLIIGAFIMPILTGIMLSTVHIDDRPRANSMANLCYNLFGYCPSPAIYGWVSHMYGGKTSRAGMLVLTSMTTINLMFIILAHYAILEKKGNKSKKQDKYVTAATDFITLPADENAINVTQVSSKKVQSTN